MSTTKRPGIDTSWVRRAPLWAIGFLVTWQMMVCLALSMCSMRGLAPFSSMSSASYCTSPR